MSVTMIFSTGDSESLLAAGPEKTPWVAAATICEAPLSASCSAAEQIVQAVSIMSSTNTQTRPETSPTTSLASTVLNEL